MRYREDKQKSAETLRLALAAMGPHDAALNPITFTVWYEHVAGINARLSEAIARSMQAGERLDDAAIERLYLAHVVDADESELRRLSGEFQQVMRRISESATHTGATAGDYGAKLDELRRVLQSDDRTALEPHLADTLAGTSRMKDSVHSLQTQVQAGRDEIERLQTALVRAREEAMLDGLTKTLNRRGFDQRIETMLQASDGGENCLVMIDIDHFKRVNDTHGHLMGDRVIKGLGEILRASVPKERGAVARYGGEEFAILIPSVGIEHGRQVAERVLATAKAMKLRDRRTQEVLFTVTVSAGVAASRRGDDAASLIARADAALYQSKQNGRDRVTCA